MKDNPIFRVATGRCNSKFHVVGGGGGGNDIGFVSFHTFMF